MIEKPLGWSKSCEWKVLETKEKFDTKINDQVVTWVMWGCWCKEGRFMTQATGQLDLGPVTDDFIPWKFLSMEQKVSWVHKILGRVAVAGYEKRLSDAIDAEQREAGYDI